MSDEPRRDPGRTRRRILAEATAEFAERGFGSARVDEIAARTATTKRMIYYYFGSKEGLFSAVLDEALAWPVAPPAPDETASGDPVAALRWFVQAIFEHDQQHPERIRLLVIANIHNARHLRGAELLTAPRLAQLTWLRDVLRRGEEAGAFRSGVDPADLLTLVSAWSVYRVTHRPSTLSLWNIDLLDDARGKRQQELVTDLLLTYLAPGSAAVRPAGPAED